MKRFYFTICLLITTFPVSAQNYSCILPGHKTFFINSNHYLRGMRIDSVETSGSNKIYFPYKTARTGAFMDGQFVDTSGGSWLGAEIIEDTTEGVTYFPTENGDTVRIKNNASLNESWVFYRDTSARYYEATIITLDTATFAGITDSVKVIRINAKEGTTTITADSLNGLQLVLSKSHGFFQVTGLYLFPYALASSMDIDYYLSLTGGYFNGLVPANLTFKRVPFSYPDILSIFDFDPGDVFNSVFTPGPYIHNYRSDSVISKVVTDSSFTYEVKYYINWNSGPYSGTDSGITTWNYEKGFLIDSAKMPEEWYNDRIYHYWYHDSSFCVTSNVYQTDLSHISMFGQLINFEAPLHTRTYKEELGEINELSDPGNDGPGALLSNSIYQARKYGHLCDGENNLGIQTFHNNISNHLKVYPNPVQERLTVKLDNAAQKGFSIQLFNLYGKKLLQQTTRQQTLSLDVGQLVPGIYFLKVTSENQSLTRKINVLH